MAKKKPPETLEEAMEDFVKKNPSYSMTVTKNKHSWVVDINMPRHNKWVRTTASTAYLAVSQAQRQFDEIKARGKKR